MLCYNYNDQARFLNDVATDHYPFYFLILSCLFVKLKLYILYQYDEEISFETQIETQNNSRLADECLDDFFNRLYWQ